MLECIFCPLVKNLSLYITF
uniref:Uncharacterized protein n=1 Tax=Rhizophora mucronata TaxID=61149 RepID=A0A2P2PXD6_RHIMU